MLTAAISVAIGMTLTVSTVSSEDMCGGLEERTILLPGPATGLETVVTETEWPLGVATALYRHH